VSIGAETVARLAKVDNIIGIKEATGSLEHISDVIRKTPDDFIVLSGDDFTCMPTIFIGGHGVISVISNVYPQGMAQMMESALAGDISKARELHYRMYDVMKLMFSTPSPSPAKKALQLMGMIKDGTPRLPIAPMSDAAVENLRKGLVGLGLV
jgi:4-hydroxy-tetrahydrodipicolinate synthase